MDLYTSLRVCYPAYKPHLVRQTINKRSKSDPLNNTNYMNAVYVHRSKKFRLGVVEISPRLLFKQSA